MKLLTALLFAVLSFCANAQITTAPALIGQRGTTLPTNCQIGQLFFKTNAAPGQNIYECTATNTWVVGNGGGNGSAAPTATISAGVLAINLANGSVFQVTLNANITSFTVTGCPATGNVCQFRIRATANGSGFTQVYPVTTRFPSGTAPVFATTNGKAGWVGFVSLDGGTTWDGFDLGQNY